MKEEFYIWLDDNFPDWTERYKYTNDYSANEDQLGIIYSWWESSNDSN